MRGKIRVPDRNSKCPNCGESFVDIGKKGFVCGDCLTVPERYFLDIHFRGKRVRIFCDKQGQPLDTHERAFDLLAHINYEIKDFSFDPSRYVKAEQKGFYISTLLDRYEEYKLKSLAPSYQSDFKRYVRTAKDFFSAKDVREIRKVDLIGFQDHLQNKLKFRSKTVKLSSKTVKNIMDFFKAFLNYVKGDLEIDYIVPKFPTIEIEFKAIQWFAPEDQAKVFPFIPEWAKPIMEFLILQGCRPSEARALKCKNVDLSKKSLTIAATFSGTVYREKRKGRRSKPYKPPIHDDLYDYISHRVKNNLPEAFIYSNPFTGRPFGKNSLDRMWNRTREKAGLPQEVLLYHFTRHSFVTNHLNSGTGMYRTSKLTGHSTVRTTEKSYAHPDVESFRVDLNKFSLNRHQTVIRDIASAK